ncbi:MAG: type III pantothenate kinase [Bacteroidota bacterium]|nr:MAG: type III pantothenate kinase [Bacteroidota bacterium]
MNLTIDIGNTQVKIALFLGNKIVSSMQIQELTSETIGNILKKYPQTDKCILSASGLIPEGTVEELKKHIPYFMQFNHQSALPFISKYETPASIGLDRLAAVAGCIDEFKDKNVLIIDAGTAITFEFKNKHNEYLGGTISSGLRMRFKALNAYTEKLPLLEPLSHTELFGKNTQDAIVSGVVNGMVYEITGVIENFEKIYDNLTVILTGGDAHFFEIKLKKTIFVLPNLVTSGLNTILNYNASNR